MRIVPIVLIMASINLSACSGMSGNVVPEKGPSMEQVYDSMKEVRATQISYEDKTSIHPLQNPHLKMYIYPHLAGKEEIPIPGYFTQFNGYQENHENFS